ncbi:MAG: putative viral replication protein [Circoviridae sp.]|nr:MAG: putative viral replication protein [Circoviridae sp.]
MQKNWCFTLNNPAIDNIALSDILLPHVGFLVFQKEMGQSSTAHFQGYAQFATKKRLSTVKGYLPRAHWEPARGTPEQNRAYCTKAEGRLEGPWTHGNMVKQGQRRDVEAFRDAILEGKADSQLLDEYATQCCLYPRFISFCRTTLKLSRNEKPTVRCFYGASGTGKTRDAYGSTEEDKVFLVSRPDSGRPLWWDGYIPRHHSTVIIDDFYGWIPWSYLLQLIDRYPFKVEIKGGKLDFNSPEIYITSNQHPREWYKNVPNNDITPLLRRIDEIKEYI